MLEEIKIHLKNSFLTLTYEDSETDGNVYKRDVQLFIKKLRKVSKKFRYFLVSEYGPKTGRPHYHLILFGLGVDSYDKILTCWGKGNITLFPVNEAMIRYCAKYHITKNYYPCGCAPPFALISKSIGLSYINQKTRKYHEFHIDRSQYNFFEKKVTLPRYYKNKLFTERERSEIAEKIRIQVEKTEIKDFAANYRAKLHLQNKFDKHYKNLKL